MMYLERIMAMNKPITKLQMLVFGMEMQIFILETESPWMIM